MKVHLNQTKFFDMDATIVMRVFTVSAASSSESAPQYIHLFSKEEDWLKSFQDNHITDDFDHSFLLVTAESYIRSNPHTTIAAKVRWRNRAGVIRFCGSGAYACSAFLLEETEAERVFLSGESIQLQANFSSQNNPARKVELHVPALPPADLFYESIPNSKLCYFSNTGIYFYECTNPTELQRADWLQQLPTSAKLPEPQGFCVFHWDVHSHRGTLRYFVPWFGRTEDYVTGSVHRWLTPFIANRYKVNEQMWHQDSSHPGALFSSVAEQHTVVLHGHYYFDR